MAVGVPNAIGAGNTEFQEPMFFGDFDLLFNPEEPNEAVGSSSSSDTEIPSSVSSEAMEFAESNLTIHPDHNLVNYSVFNFEGEPFNAPTLPPNVKEQILYATASYKDATGHIHIHKNFRFSQLSPFEVATLYRVINSYHKFWENIQTPGLSIYHKHLDLLEEYMVGLAWEDPERASQVITCLTFFQDANVHGAIEKIVQENYKLVGHTRIEHANLLIQHAIVLFNYNDAESQPRLLSEAVKKQIQYASCCYKNASGELVLHKNFKFDHLSAQDVVMLFRVLNSYYSKWDLPQNGANAVFDRYLASMEDYIVDLCWSNNQKARNVRATIEDSRMTTLQNLAGKMDEQLVKLNGFTLVLHAALIEHYARVCFNYDNDNFWYLPVPETVKTLIRLSTKCYRNAEGNVLVHKDFKFDHLTAAEFARLYRILNSYYRLYDDVQHQENAVYQKHLSMMEEYIEGLCWTDRPRMQDITDKLLTYSDPYLHDIIQKQTSYLLNLLPYSLIDHANTWFNFDNSNPTYSTLYEPLSDLVKEQIKFAVFTILHVNGTKEIHKNFKYDHLSVEELTQLYTVIYTYYDAYNHRMNREVYKGHVESLQRHIENICWRDPARGNEVREALLRRNSSAVMTGFIQKINGIIQITSDAAPVRNADMLITYAERAFDENTLSETVKNNLRLASVCYETPNGIVVHGHFPSDDISPEDLAKVFWIITAYSNEGRYRLNQAALFQNHLAVLEEHFEKLCWNDLQKVERLRAALESFQDPDLQQMVVKLSYYIANLSGFNIISYVDFWFPVLSEPVKQQVRYATLYHLELNGSRPSLHPKFTFDHLSSIELVTLYRIFKSYVDFPFQQDTSDYRLHLDVIDNYITTQLPRENHDKAIEVRALMLNMTDEFLNPILQKLNSHPTLRCDRSLFRYLEDQDKFKTLQGGGAMVYLYQPNAVLKKVVPQRQGVAVKQYFINTPDEENLQRLFDIEVDFLQKMQGYAGVPRLLDYDRVSRTVMMSAITEKHGLTLIKEQPDRLEELCVRHMQSLVKLHTHTVPAFRMDPVIENHEGDTLEMILGIQEMNCISHFRGVIQNCPDATYRQHLEPVFNDFIQRASPNRSRLAMCLNDSCIDSYFPESDIFIDFNAAGKSPIERDVAAAIVNLLLHLNFNIGLKVPREEMKQVLLRMIETYREEYMKENEDFDFSMDYLRFFFAQQLTILSGALIFNRNFQVAGFVQQAVLTLLDGNSQPNMDEILDLVLSGHNRTP